MSEPSEQETPACEHARKLRVCVDCGRCMLMATGDYCDQHGEERTCLLCVGCGTALVDGENDAALARAESVLR